MRRIFFIVAAAIVIIGLMIGAYFLFFTGQAPTLTVGDPFSGLGGGSANQPSGGEIGVISNAGTVVAPRLIRIADGPVAEGAVAVYRPEVPAVYATTTSATATPVIISEAIPADTDIRYIDRASGNVYSFLAQARTLTRISNKTLPGIQEASWLSDGSRAYARFLPTGIAGTANQITTYALQANGGEGFVLEQGLAQASVSGSSTLFTLLSGTNGSVGSLARADGSLSRTLFSTVLTSLIVHPTSGNLYAATKATYAYPGYAFQINRTNGAFSRILGGLRGLAVLPNPQGTSVLYSYTDRGTYRLAFYDVTGRTTTALPLATLVEKCAWSADGRSAYCGIPTSMTGLLPDDWYQGATAFSDRLWKIDLASRTASLIIDPSEAGNVAIDATALAVDSQEDVLVFTDRGTGSIWMYDL